MEEHEFVEVEEEEVRESSLVPAPSDESGEEEEQRCTVGTDGDDGDDPEAVEASLPQCSKYFVSSIDGICDKMEIEGFLAGVPEDDEPRRPPMTVMSVLDSTCEKFGERIALTSCDDKDYTYNEYRRISRRAAKGFMACGLNRFDGVPILGFNSPNYFFCSVGSIFAGGVTVGVYPTNGPSACKYVVDETDSKIICVDTAANIHKFCDLDPSEKVTIIIMNENEKVDKEKFQSERPGFHILLWDEFLDMGDSVPDEELEARVDAQLPGHCCCIIFTSGTTGHPKGVMISHDNITYTAYQTVRNADASEEDTVISFLPLSHIAAQVVDIHVVTSAGGRIYFAAPDALRGMCFIRHMFPFQERGDVKVQLLLMFPSPSCACVFMCRFFEEYIAENTSNNILCCAPRVGENDGSNQRDGSQIIRSDKVDGKGSQEGWTARWIRQARKGIIFDALLLSCGKRTAVQEGSCTTWSG